MNGNYEDIINLPHHQSSRRPKMSSHDRAAQFSPFAALTGHDEAIKETARLTDKKIDLDEATKSDLDEKFSYILEHIAKMPEITVEFFIPDEHKEGGMYINYTGNIKKYNVTERIIIFSDKTTIPVDDIISIESPIFPEITETI